VHIACTYCVAPATHTLAFDRTTGHWRTRATATPQWQQAYCQRCAEALAAGETGEDLSRRLNREYTARLNAATDDDNT
jgi:hypothetical protein